MKRALPVFLLVVGILGVGLGGFWLWQSFKKPVKIVEEEKVPQLQFSEKPVVTLVPLSSCEYSFEVEKIKKGVVQLEYEITYKNADGVVQGVPGKVDLKGDTKISRKVLFGTESSGNRRCDKGVSAGKIELEYRDKEGGILASLDLPFKVLEDIDGIELEEIEVSFDRVVSKAVILRNTGFLGQAPTGVYASEPYSVFASGSGKVGVSVVFSKAGNIYGWNGEAWTELPGGKASFLGTYLLVSP